MFDNLGFLLFRSERVQRPFSGRVTFTSWALQQVLTWPTWSLENTGQSFVLKFPLPRTTEWCGFYSSVLTHILGASRDLANGRSPLFGGGGHRFGLIIPLGLGVGYGHGEVR